MFPTHAHSCDLRRDITHSHTSCAQLQHPNCKVCNAKTTFSTCNIWHDMCMLPFGTLPGQRGGCASHRGLSTEPPPLLTRHHFLFTQTTKSLLTFEHPLPFSFCLFFLPFFAFSAFKHLATHALTCQCSVVALNVEFEIVHESILAQEAYGGGGIPVILVLRGLLCCMWGLGRGSASGGEGKGHVCVTVHCGVVMQWIYFHSSKHKHTQAHHSMLMGDHHVQTSSQFCSTPCAAAAA